MDDEPSPLPLPPPVFLGRTHGTPSAMAAALRGVEERAPRRAAWAVLRLAERILAELERRRLVNDDRPEGALAAWRDACRREPLDLTETFGALLEARQAAARRGADAEESGYEALAALAYAVLPSAVHRPATFKRQAVEQAALQLVSPDEPRPAPAPATARRRRGAA